MNRFVKAGLVFASAALVAACSSASLPEPDSEASTYSGTNVKLYHMATVNGRDVEWFCDGPDKILILEGYKGIAAMANHPDCPAVRAHPSGGAQ